MKRIPAFRDPLDRVNDISILVAALGSLDLAEQNYAKRDGRYVKCFYLWYFQRGLGGTCCLRPDFCISHEVPYYGKYYSYLALFDKDFIRDRIAKLYEEKIMNILLKKNENP